MSLRLYEYAVKIKTKNSYFNGRISGSSLFTFPCYMKKYKQKRVAQKWSNYLNNLGLNTIVVMLTTELFGEENLND